MQVMHRSSTIDLFRSRSIRHAQLPAVNKRGTGQLSPTGTLICVPGDNGVVGSATTSCISYSPSSNWNHEQPNISTTLNGSPFTTFQTIWTTTQGSKASLSFKGTGIVVEAIYPVLIDPPPAQVLFTIDSQTPVTATALNGTASAIPTSQVIFTTPALSNGVHNLTMQLLNTGNFTFHFFLVFGGGLSNPNSAVASDDANSSSQSRGSATSRGTMATGTTSSVGALSPSISSEMSSSRPSNHPNVGGIVGGVIGGILLLLGLVNFILFLRRRLAKARMGKVQTDTEQARSETIARFGSELTFEEVPTARHQNSAEFVATVEKYGV